MLAASCTDKKKCGGKDRKWVREKVRYHYLAGAHCADRLIQTELLSARLKLRQSDRPVNVSENNIGQTRWLDRIIDSQHFNKTVSGPARSQTKSVNPTTSQLNKMGGYFTLWIRIPSSDIRETTATTSPRSGCLMSVCWCQTSNLLYL